MVPVTLGRTAARTAAVLLLACFGAAQSPKTGGQDGAEEQFKAVDPYTKGDAELVRGAGYVSLAPFQFAQGIQPIDMAEVLGGIELVWAETAHFKICSSLQTYKLQGDAKESAALAREFAVLAERLPGFKPPRNKLDPWLRLHLYALRLELLYTEFCRRTGFKDSDFHAAGTEDAMGSGPHLGMPLKPTVLLAAKSSTLGRFNRRFTGTDETVSHRTRLPGGSMYFGISAESLSERGFPLDAALHCAVAANAVCCLLDGLRDSYWATPLWFDFGMGYWFSRRIDERFNFYANGTSRYLDDDLYKWHPRVRGLVENKFDYSWRAMLSTLEWSQLTPQAHMFAWSRVEWMLHEDGTNLRAFLEPVSVRLNPGSNEEQTALQVERAASGLAACFGKTPEECDAAWRAWVLKTYPKK